MPLLDFKCLLEMLRLLIIFIGKKAALLVHLFRTIKSFQVGFVEYRSSGTIFIWTIIHRKEIACTRDCVSGCNCQIFITKTLLDIEYNLKGEKKKRNKLTRGEIYGVAT